MKSAHIGFVCKTFGELDETIKGKQQCSQLSSCIPYYLFSRRNVRKRNSVWLSSLGPYCLHVIKCIETHISLTIIYVPILINLHMCNLNVKLNKKNV